MASVRVRVTFRVRVRDRVKDIGVNIAGIFIYV